MALQVLLAGPILALTLTLTLTLQVLLAGPPADPCVRAMLEALV